MTTAHSYLISFTFAHSECHTCTGAVVREQKISFNAGAMEGAVNVLTPLMARITLTFIDIYLKYLQRSQNDQSSTMPHQYR